MPGHPLDHDVHGSSPRTRYLEEVTRWTLDALDLVVAFGHLQSRFTGNQDLETILEAARAHLQRLLPFRTLAFLTIDESSSDFVLASCEPGAERSTVRCEVERQISGGTFAWALRQSRAVTVPAMREDDTLVLHVLVSGSRAVGMFVGLARGSELNLTDASSNLLSLILFNTAQALEHARLYATINAHNRELEQAIQRRTRELRVALEDAQTLARENARLYRDAQKAYDDLSRTQAQLAQTQKMEAVGRLAGGVAHDFNNLLTVIRGRTELALTGLPAGSSLHHSLDLILKTADRATRLTQQLLAFSRKQVLQPRVLALGLLVSNTGDLLRRIIGEHIELVVRPGSPPGRVKADPGQIEQVILNLAVNARDAMPDGGRLTLQTENVVLDEEFAAQHRGSRPGRYVALSVRDTGAGMDSDTLTHLFEPFFTTKGPGKGTGLGLATVYGIVKQSGGYIDVASERSRGSTFTVYLPSVDDATEAVESGQMPPGMPRGTETILLAEDEEGVRDFAREVLERSGYTVLQAQHGEDALRICLAYGGPIHLLVTDVVMPQMSGPKLAGQLASLKPGTAVLYVSGYTDDSILHHGVLDPGTVFLQKPFTADALAHKVREVLDGGLLAPPRLLQSL